jgi:ribosomal-protein-serine acetyltransferase
MTFNNWRTETLQSIQPEEFHEFVMSNKEHISKTFPVTLVNCSDLENTRDFFTRKRDKEQNQDGYHFYLRHNETQNLIGYVCIKNVNKNIQKCELAYFVDKDFEGRGIISKAVSETVDFCFNTIAMNKVFICTSKVNTASQRIATKHGFRQEGILREEFKNGDAILEDIVYFGLLKSEYQS